MAGVSSPESKLPERSKFPEGHSGSYETTGQYFKALENWLQCVQNLKNAHAVAQMWSYHYYCSQLAALSSPQVVSDSQQRQTRYYGPFVYIRRRERQPPARAPVPIGRRCRLAPVWRRIVAQLIDFLFLSFSKLLIGLATAYIFGFLKWNPFDPSRQWDWNKALDSVSQWLESDEITPDLILLEIANVLFDTLYETTMMQLNFMNTGKGRTIGKAMMEIRVVSCRKATTLQDFPEELVFVQPGTDIKFVWNLGRSLLKNIVLSMLLPLTFLMFFFKHHRTGYDVMCHTIVIKDHV